MSLMQMIQDLFYSKEYKALKRQRLRTEAMHIVRQDRRERRRGQMIIDPMPAIVGTKSGRSFNDARKAKAQERYRTIDDVPGYVPGAIYDSTDHQVARSHPSYHGHGGTFDGGGASSDWSSSRSSSSSSSYDSGSSSSSSSDSGSSSSSSSSD